ncbi:MAG: decaprenyl-phosphate phosphoribosyltransferase [Methanothrix sp.]
MFKSVLVSMRPYQWYKNLVIFIGIVFSGNLFNLGILQYSIFAFIFFVFISGAIYIINDIKDVEMDRLHPQKRFRPIAVGTLSARTALLFAFILLSISLTTSFLVDRSLCYIGLLYIFVNFLYTFYLKNIALIDIMMVAVGFVLRAIAGCFIISVWVSPWLILCVLLMAFVLAFGKRRHELLTTSSNTRSCLSQYTENMVDSLLNISVAMLLMSYALYSFNVDAYMMITLPFAFYGAFRFVQLVYEKNFGGEAELILKDRASLANLVLWTVSVIWIIYEVNV